LKTHHTQCSPPPCEKKIPSPLGERVRVRGIGIGEGK